ncbi:MAG: hypothetical protein AAF747_01630 [Planctomycetota bacterium]
MSLVYVGIDEAGYGPMLGPLCVGLVALRLGCWTPDDGQPDLWQSLDAAVCRSAGRTERRIAVADSKKLKLSNQLKTKHPLTHLERGVLTFDAASREDHAIAATDAELFDRLGARLPSDIYAGEAVPLPLATTHDALALDRNDLLRALHTADVEVLTISVLTVSEQDFNAGLSHFGSKAGVCGSVVGRLLARAVQRWGDSPMRIITDRQSGRTRYAELLQPAGEVEITEESPRCSRYRLTDAHDATVTFQPEAEDAHLPVALASMAAKLTRELAMARFNRHWCARMPDLKPTAGYVQDARRWLADLGDAATDDERAAMIRLA